MWVLEKIKFRPQLPLLASLGILAVIVWYSDPGKFIRVLKGCRGSIIAFALIAWMAVVGAALPDADLSNGGIEILKPVFDFFLFLMAIPLAILFASATNWKMTCGLALCASVISILVDTVSPGTFSTLTYRAAGFGVNPNMGAAQTGLLLIGVLDWKNPNLSLTTCCWCLFAFMGVFLTLSRSGILLLGIVWTMYVYLNVRRNGAKTVVFLGGLAFCVAAFTLTVAEFAKGVFTMLDGTNARVKLFSGEYDAINTSEDSRVILIYDYVDLIGEHPILGWGTGYNSATELGSHNMFLTRWVDNGIFGLGAYLLLIWMLYQTGRKNQSWESLAIASNLLVQCFFSHNLLEDRTLLLMIAISAGRSVLDPPQLVIPENAISRSGNMPYHPRTRLQAG